MMLSTNIGERLVSSDIKQNGGWVQDGAILSEKRSVGNGEIAQESLLLRLPTFQSE